MANSLDERELELYRRFMQGQEKYEYFFMVLAGAAMAFAVKQTSDDILNWAKLPLGIAVFLWGWSFFSGYKRRGYTLSFIYSNVQRLRIDTGNHEDVGDHPQLINAASEGISKAMKSNGVRSELCAKSQMYSFFAGMIMFVVWHITEMVLRNTSGLTMRMS